MFETWAEQALAEREAEESAYLASLPTCDRCGEPIQDEYGYRLPDGSTYCHDCVEDMRFEIVNDFY